MRFDWRNLGKKIWMMEQIGLFWLLCSIPVVTFGSATAAAYYTTMKVVRRDTGSVKEAFFHSFRENLKQGIPLFLINLLMFALLGFNLFSHWNDFSQTGLLIRIGSAFFVMILLGINHYLYPALSRFSVPFHRFFVMSLQMSVRFLISTFILDCYLVAAIYVLIEVPVLILIIPGLWMFLISLSVEKALKLFMPPVEEGTSDEDQWYNQ